MKKKVKSVVALVLSAAMIFSLAACGAGNTGDAQDSGKTDTSAKQEAPAEETDQETQTADVPEDLKIGVILTFTNNGYGLTVKQYLDHVGEELGIEFQYAEAQEVEVMTSAIENFIASDVDGIISMPVFNLQNEVELASSAGIYYAVCGSTVQNEADYEAVKDNPYYVGSIGNNDAASTEGMVKVLVDRYNCKDFGLVSLPMGTSDMHDGRYEGVKKGVEETGANLVVEGLAYNLTESSQNMVAQYPDLDCMIALAGGIEECMQPILSAGKGGEILFAGFREEPGAEGMFEDGTLACLGVGTPINALFAFINLYNAITGDVLVPAEGEKMNFDMDTIYVCDADEYLTYVGGAMDKDPYTIDEIKKYLTAFNPDVTYDEYEEFMAGYSLEYLASIQ